VNKIISVGSVEKMNNEEKELFEVYQSAFNGCEQQLSLAAVAEFNRLSKKHEKEEIRTIAEILKALATAPTVLQR